jgi:hypothetical protein
MRLRFWKKKSQAPAKKPLANRSSRRKRIAGVLLAAAAGAYAGAKLPEQGLLHLERKADAHVTRLEQQNAKEVAQLLAQRRSGRITEEEWEKRIEEHGARAGKEIEDSVAYAEYIRQALEKKDSYRIVGGILGAGAGGAQNRNSLQGASDGIDG